VEPAELDAPPIAGDVVELLALVPVSLPERVALPETVPVAPMELVPLVGAPVDVSVLALLLVEPPEPVVVDGDVDAVDELVEGVDPGVVVLLVVDEVVLDSRFVHAPSDRATTASTAAVSWVVVIFIRKLLERFAIGVRGRAAATALPRL
jgi:hypothetical protein